jgi:hypothetical protein
MSTKILISGLLVAVVVLVVGQANTNRIERRLGKLVADCLAEPTGETEGSPFDRLAECDPRATPSERIQSEIVKTQRELSNAQQWVFPGALVIAILSALPWIWYFPLPRIRKMWQSVVLTRKAMHRPSEGMRRLGIVIGIVASVTWFIFIMGASNGFARVEPSGWVIFLIGIPTCFGLGFLVIWGIDWVNAGFRQGIRG